MKQCLLISDTHGQLEDTQCIVNAYPHMDYYFHMGDVGFNLKELGNFIIVRGNHDHNSKLPFEKIIEIEDHRILCMHGYLFDEETIQEVLAHEDLDGEEMMKLCMNILNHKLANYTKERNCDILLFGHTHHQCFTNCEGVTLINPGSVSFGTPVRGFAIMKIDSTQVKVTFHDLKEIVK